jgi:pimeloyl-ACP methyl ester carboxylesterase
MLLTLVKKSIVATSNQIKRPQTPKPPFPYRSEEVDYYNTDKSIHFAATFTVPLPDPNVDYFRAPVYPVVILITGSGPQDRDETILGHKPFAVIADHLTRQGIAVLRVDERGMGKTTGNFSKATTGDFANDVEAGIEYLKNRLDVDTNSIGLIGHSEGGLIAPMVASKRKDIAFIILLAGPGINIMDMMTQQSADIMASAGISASDIEQYRPLYKNMVTAVINAKDSAEASQKAISVFKKWQNGKTASTIKNTTGVETEIDIIAFTNAFIRDLSGPWFLYFLKLNPYDYLSKTSCPVLALNGEKDIQVAAKPNLAGIENALKKNKQVTTREMPGLNHLFQHCKTCMIEEYGELEESFDPETLVIISDWIKTGRFKIIKTPGR